MISIFLYFISTTILQYLRKVNNLSSLRGRLVSINGFISILMHTFKCITVGNNVVCKLETVISYFLALIFIMKIWLSSHLNVRLFPWFKNWLQERSVMLTENIHNFMEEWFTFIAFKATELKNLFPFCWFTVTLMLCYHILLYFYSPG